MKFNKIYFLILVSISALFLIYVSTYRNGNKEIFIFETTQENSVKKTVNGIKYTLAKGLLEYDSQLIERAIKAAFKNNNLSKIMILDLNGKFIFGLERKQMIQVVPLTSFFLDPPSKTIPLRIKEDEIAGQLLFLYKNELNQQGSVEENRGGFIEIMLIILLLIQGGVIANLLFELNEN